MWDGLADVGEVGEVGGGGGRGQHLQDNCPVELVIVHFINADVELRCGGAARDGEGEQSDGAVL